jgi:ProP effector
MASPDGKVNAVGKPLSKELAKAHRFLAQCFPLAFALAPHLPHRPLKCGIHEDLLAIGFLATPKEAHRILGSYCQQRRMYLLAVVEGAVRVDLNGDPAGIVTAHEADLARADLARLDAAADRQALEAKQAHAAARSARKAQHAANKTSPPAPAPPAPPAPPPRGPRLGIADLKASALARRHQSQHEHPATKEWSK